MWREGLRVRDEIFQEESRKQQHNLCTMLATRDYSMKKALESRAMGWLNSLQHCKDSLRLNTQELINNRCTPESNGKRQRELVKSNANIFDWAMKIVSDKKKVPLLNIQISDYIPYTIVPKDVIDPFIPFTNLEKSPKETKKN